MERWRFPTGAVVTASPSIATVTLPAGSSTRAVFVPSWDGFVYAIDWDDGSELWRFAWEDQPGASFPAAGSVTVADVGGRRTVFVGAGEHVYALDAATGAERWRFAAGTGCRDAGRPAAGALRVPRGAQPGRVHPAGRRRHGVLRHGRQRRRHRQGRLLRGRRRTRHPGLVLRRRDAARCAAPIPSDDHPAVRRLPQRGAARSARRLPRRRARAAATTGRRRVAATCGRRPPTTRSGTCCTSAPATATPTPTRRPRCRRRRCPATTRRWSPSAWTARRLGRGGLGRWTTTTSPSVARRTSSRSTWTARPPRSSASAARTAPTTSSIATA